MAAQGARGKGNVLGKGVVHLAVEGLSHACGIEKLQLWSRLWQGVFEDERPVSWWLSVSLLESCTLDLWAEKAEAGKRKRKRAKE